MSCFIFGANHGVMSVSGLIVGKLARIDQKSTFNFMALNLNKTVFNYQKSKVLIK